MMAAKLSANQVNREKGEEEIMGANLEALFPLKPEARPATCVVGI